MNSLRKRAYYDHHSAADILGCSVQDLYFYIKEGDIDCWIPRRLYINRIVVPYDALPNKVIQEIIELKKHPQEFRRTYVEIDDSLINEHRVERPEFLQIFHKDLGSCLTTHDQPPIYQAFTLGLPCGMPAAFFNEHGLLDPIPIGSLNNAGVLTESVITAEDIKKLNEDAEENTQVHADPSIQHKAPMLYLAPDGSDDAGRKIAEYANKFVEETNHHPSVSDMWAFLLKHAEACGFENDGPTNRWYLQDRIINKRGLKSRLSKYREEAKNQLSS